MSTSTSDINTALNNFSSVISSAASSFAAGKSDEATMNFQREMNEDQQDFSREMWIKTNDYNTPQNQVARLKSAGLNPALLYGNTTSGLASSVGQSGSSGVATNYKAQAFAQQAALQLQLARQSAEINNIEANTEKTKSETAGQNNENQLFNATFDSRVESFLLSNKQVSSNINHLNSLTGLSNSQTNLVNLQASGQQLTNSYNQATLTERIHQTSLHSSEIEATINKLSADTNYQKEATRLLGYNATTARISANASATSASAQLISAKTAEFLAPYQAKQLSQQTKLGVAQCLLLEQETYKAKSEGDLNNKKIEQLTLEVANEYYYGHKELFNGSVFSLYYDILRNLEYQVKSWYK